MEVMRLFTSLLAGMTLAVGFGVAQITGNRPVGGIVLVIGAAICGYRWWQSVGWFPTIASEFVFLRHSWPLTLLRSRLVPGQQSR